ADDCRSERLDPARGLRLVEAELSCDRLRAAELREDIRDLHVSLLADWIGDLSARALAEPCRRSRRCGKARPCAAKYSCSPSRPSALAGSLARWRALCGQRDCCRCRAA